MSSVLSCAHFLTSSYLLAGGVRRDLRASRGLVVARTAERDDARAQAAAAAAERDAAERDAAKATLEAGTLLVLCVSLCVVALEHFLITSSLLSGELRAKLASKAALGGADGDAAETGSEDDDDGRLLAFAFLYVSSLFYIF